MKKSTRPSNDDIAASKIGVFLSDFTILSAEFQIFFDPVFEFCFLGFSRRRTVTSNNGFQYESDATDISL